jgi:hypothetical protein
MSYFVPEGAKFYFSETFATAKGITALTNANPAVATAAAHGFVDNNEVLLNLGWEDANGVWRVDQIDANSFAILGLDATDTDFYAPGGGTGTAQLVSGWTEIPQVLNINTTGGDPSYTQIRPLSRRNAINKAVGFNPSSIELTLGHDESLPAMHQPAPGAGGVQDGAVWRHRVLCLRHADGQRDPGAHVGAAEHGAGGHLGGRPDDHLLRRLTRHAPLWHRPRLLSLSSRGARWLGRGPFVHSPRRNPPWPRSSWAPGPRRSSRSP